MGKDGNLTAIEVARQVGAGTVKPTEIVDEALRRIDERNPRVNAFVGVMAEKARAQAEELSRRTDLDSLPLAGVPIAVKDNVSIAGEPMRAGSVATVSAPSAADHQVVARLRAAGAVVVGRTATPELGAWAVTDGVDGTVKNPWNLDRTPGGSSGGSAAAVASGMVPIAHGNDGLGSIRIPSACCGLFGIKPGYGLVPADVGVNSWYDMVENGPLATTVADAALLLSVMAARPQLAELIDPGQLRIALAVGSPIPIVRVDRYWMSAARTAAAVLVSAGHLVETAVLPYPKSPIAEFSRWTAGSATNLDDMDPSALQRRNRTHVAIGRVADRLNLVRPAAVERIRDRLREFFDDYDLVITPTLAQSPPAAKAWSEKSWIANMIASVGYAPFAALWNMAGWPAASVPIGIHPTSGTPLAAQIAGPPGSEERILALAAQIESRRPWQRIAPGF